MKVYLRGGPGHGQWFNVHDTNSSVVYAECDPALLDSLNKGEPPNPFGPAVHHHLYMADGKAYLDPEIAVFVHTGSA